MAKLQIKRGTTSSISSYSISVGEILLNTTKNSLIIGDSALAKREISLLPVSPVTNTYLNSSGNWVNIQDASSTVSGIVNISNQTFSGEKTFSSKLNINSSTESILSMSSENASNVYIDLLRIGYDRYSWRISNAGGNFEISTFLTSDPATQTSKFKISYNGGITIGEWKATTISPQYGGTGLNNIPVGQVIIGNGTSTPTTVGFDTIATLNSNKLMTSDSIYRNIYNGKTGYVANVSTPGWYRVIHNQDISSSASSVYFTIRTNWNTREPTNINCILTMNGISKGAQLTILSCSGQDTGNIISKIRVVHGSTINNLGVYIDVYYTSSLENNIYVSVYHMAPYLTMYEPVPNITLAPDIPTGYTSVEATVKNRIYGNELGDFVSGSLSASKTGTQNLLLESVGTSDVSLNLNRTGGRGFKFLNASGTLYLQHDWDNSAKVPAINLLHFSNIENGIVTYTDIRPYTDADSVPIDLGTTTKKFNNLYAKRIIGAADKLYTSRSFSITGEVESNTVSFDGSANVSITSEIESYKFGGNYTPETWVLLLESTHTYDNADFYGKFRLHGFMSLFHGNGHVNIIAGPRDSLSIVSKISGYIDFSYTNIFVYRGTDSKIRVYLRLNGICSGRLYYDRLQFNKINTSSTTAPTGTLLYDLSTDNNDVVHNNDGIYDVRHLRSKTLTVTNGGIDPNVTFSSQSAVPVTITLDRGSVTNYQIVNNGTLRILCDYITSKVPYFEILRIGSNQLEVIRDIRPMTNNYSDLGSSSLKFKNIYAYNTISDTYTGEIKGIDTGFDITGSGWRRLYTLNTTFAHPQTCTASISFRLHSRYSHNLPCSATFQIETRYSSAPIITMINGTRGAGVLGSLRAVYSSTDPTILHIDVFFGNSLTNKVVLTTIYNDRFLNVYDGTIIPEDQSPLSVYNFPINIDGMIINTNLTLIDGNSSQVCRLGDFGIFNRRATRLTSGFDTISDSGLYDSAPDPTAFNTSLYTQIAQFTSADTDYAMQIASTMTGNYQEYGIRRKSDGSWRPWANLLTSSNSPLTESSFLTNNSTMGWYKVMRLRMISGRTHGYHVTLLVTHGRCATATIEIVVQSVNDKVLLSSTTTTPAYMKIIQMNTPIAAITSFDPTHFKLMYECDTYPNPKTGPSYVELWVYSGAQGRAYQFDVLSTHSFNIDASDTISTSRNNIVFTKNPIKETTGDIAPLLEGTSWGSIPLTFGIIKQDIELNSPIVINGNVSNISNMNNFNGYSIIKNGRTFVDTKNLTCVGGDGTSWSFSTSNYNLIITKNSTIPIRHAKFWTSKGMIAGEKYLFRIKFKTSLTKTSDVILYFTLGTSTTGLGSINLGTTEANTWVYKEVIVSPSSLSDGIAFTSTYEFTTIGETIEVEYMECIPINMDTVPIMRDTTTGNIYKLNINNGVLGIVQL